MELKPYLPSKNFELSSNFYNKIGFITIWNDGEIALMDHSGFRFILQRFYVKEFAENFVMHLLVLNADDWWKKLSQITVCLVLI